MITGYLWTVMTTVETRKDLIERLRRHRDDLRRLGGKRIGLFGSFQRDKPDAESDVDPLVEFAPEEIRPTTLWLSSFFWRKSLNDLSNW